MVDPYGGTSVRIERDDGRELVADGQWSGGWAVEWEGLEDFLTLPIAVNTAANVIRDGSTLVGKRVEEAERTMSIVYAGPRDPAEVREEVLSFLNPKRTFRVHVTHMGRTRWCEGELVERECDIAPSRAPCRATFTILCLDPYMRSEDYNENSLTDAAPMFGFPYVSHARQQLPRGERHPVGSLASKLLYDGLNTVYNNGDVETDYRIVCRALGDLSNPRFEKDGRHVTVMTTMRRGDEIVVDFSASPPSVTLNGENAIQMCTRDSDFVNMGMQVGGNVFQYSCEPPENRSYMDVQINYHRRYLGV